MKYIFLFFAVFPFSLPAQDLYFPPISGTTWETYNPAELGWCEDKIPELLAFLDEKNTKGFLILKDGKIVVEEYFDDFQQTDTWYWASAGKSLTAFLTGMAQEQGLLNIEDKTSDYLGTGWTNAPLEKEDLITVRHQLTMTSGLDDGTGDTDCTDPACLQYKADAGTRWAYHNAAYTLIEKVVEAAAGQTYNLFTYNNLSTKTGINGLWVNLDYNNIFFSTPRNMARFGLLNLNKGKWANETILGDMDYYNNMVNTSQNLNLGYGYLWWLNGKPSFMLPGLQLVIPGSIAPAGPADMYSGLGKNGQYMCVVPSQNLVVVRMGDTPDNSLVPIVFLNEIWEKINTVICTETADNEVVESDGFEIYPNPAGQFLYLGNNSGTHPVHILDYTGKTIWSGIPTGGKIDVGGLLPGLYVIKTGAGNELKYKRFLKG